ncbi:hypothetical protein EJB05_06432, partial [Eragrostis curvula]
MDDVLVDILVRLPPSCIGRCRVVCRAWRAATSTPSFDRAHAARCPPAAAATVTPEYPIRYRHAASVRFAFSPCRWYTDNLRERGHRPSALPLSGVAGKVASTEAIGSWGGIVCAQLLVKSEINSAGSVSYLLWNTLTGAWTTVSAPAGDGRIIGGYSHPATGRFHLLHSSDEAAPSVGRNRNLVAPITFRVLRVGDNTGWREVPMGQALLAASKTFMFMSRDRDRLAHRPVTLHGNLHWLVQLVTGGVALLVFDTSTEEFRFMPAPARKELMELRKTRLGVLPAGKLCIFALEEPRGKDAMEMWVLDDYSPSSRRSSSWRLRERIKTVAPDRTDLSVTFMDPAAEVEVVEGVEGAEEIFLRLASRIDAYSVRYKWWGNVTIVEEASLVMHRDSLLPGDISFGDAVRVLLQGNTLRQRG